MSGPPAWVSKYIKDVEQHGPLPVGIHAVKDGDTAQYQITVNNNRTSSLHHPLSSEGREEWRDVMSMAREEEGSKAHFPGSAHPPLVYKPGEWLWKRMDGNVVTIMIRALQISGINVATEDFRNQKNKDAVKQMELSHQSLYHPCDRESLATFPEEHMISCWARHFGRGLVVIAPEFHMSRQNYAAHLEPDPKHRPAVRARYSTGFQEEFPPIVLGCLPTGMNTSVWFCMEPVEATKNVFHSLWNGCNWAQQATRFGYKDTEHFIWAAVAIQRSIMVGASTYDDSVLGDVLRQYGQYLAADDSYGKQVFRYNPGNGPPPSPTLTYHELTRWILTSDKDSSAKRHAKAWDAVIMARVTHQETLRLSDWDKLIQAATAAQFKK